ncbi:unnamed protein product [Mytilus coruscus]|uniref:Uncharacterized protein n=1 Tax=Mytilus coruscus TaxID=42192 RepID=A0A6J8E9U7_MYTCO|nr:unnamed protein product [Mytilus coruscus]
MLIKTNVPTHDIPPLRDPNQNFKFAYEETETSVILNNFFGYISNLDEASKDLPEVEDRCVDFPSQIIVSEQDVRDIVSTLDANKAVGPDIVSNRMSLAVRNKMSKPLFLINLLMIEFFPINGNFHMLFPYSKVVTQHCRLTTGLSPHCHVVDGFSGVGRLFTDHTPIGHTAPNESILRHSISTYLVILEVRGNFGQVNSDRLENIQIEAARIVTGLPNYASRNSISKRTGWEKLSVRREVK